MAPPVAGRQREIRVSVRNGVKSKRFQRRRRSDVCSKKGTAKSSLRRRSCKSFDDVTQEDPDTVDYAEFMRGLKNERRYSEELTVVPLCGVTTSSPIHADFRGKRIECNGMQKTFRELGVDIGLCSDARSSSSFSTPMQAGSRRPQLRSQLSDPSGTTQASVRRPESSGKSLMNFTGMEPHAVSYSAINFKGNFDPLSCSWPVITNKVSVSDCSLEDSWKSICTALIASQNLSSSPISFRNPNKAAITIEYPSTKILIANNAAHRLFAVGHDQLQGRRLSELIAGSAATNRRNGEGPSAMDGSRILSEDNGQLNSYCGKVIEIVDALGAVLPAAIWLYPLASQRHEEVLFPEVVKNNKQTRSRCLAVLEPVERISATCTLGPNGLIFVCDNTVADVFGYGSGTEILGCFITELVPALILPTSKIDTDHLRQDLTGRFRNKSSFPITVKIMPVLEDDEITKYEVTFHVYTTISGLITVLPNGKIHSFNSHFVSAMFGLYTEQLAEKSISDIIPRFYDEMYGSDADSASFYLDERTSDTEVCRQFSELAFSSGNLKVGSKNSLVMNANAATDGIEDLATEEKPRFFSTSTASLADRAQRSELDLSNQITEGSFWGMGLHRDGSLFGIGYQIRRLLLKDGSVLYCIWIVRDPEANVFRNLCRLSARNKSDSSAESATERFRFVLPPTNPAVDLESEQKEHIRGEYAQNYDTLQQIGKGAYGCVKMAARKSDGLLVVTKFIRKNRILSDTWFDDKRLGRIPLEIYLLMTLKHENIVEVMDVFQNDAYFQVVMKKHGSGMDLFEFIDRRPIIDEKLCSYLFRQVVSAVSYLHKLNIVHRDIKDENVIIDERFQCKIIDFGSATHMQQGKLFSTICGTIEYCSPEVLSGNRYAGPELEMWTLGILLYTLSFFQTPFDNVEEIIRADLEVPWEVSDGLFNLLSWLLHPLPQCRATISEVEKHWWLKQTIDIRSYKFEDIVPLYEPREARPAKYLSDLTVAGLNSSVFQPEVNVPHI